MLDLDIGLNAPTFDRTIHDFAHSDLALSSGRTVAISSVLYLRFTL